MKRNNIITTVVFLVLVGALTVASMVNPVRQYSETENRTLAQLPKFSFKALFSENDDEKYTLKYEEFITDQFVFRDAWITVKNYAELALGKKDSGGVYFGKDGYLIEKHELDKDRLESNIEYLKALIDNAGSQYNVRVLIAPTASLMLSDKLPAFAPVWNQEALLDRLAEFEGFVDVRDILKKHLLDTPATDPDRLYYRTDHHWTTLGAYYAYFMLCDSLGFDSTPFEEFTKTVLSDEFYGTLASKVNIKTKPDVLYTLDTSLPLSVTYNRGTPDERVTDTLYELRHLDTRSKYSVFLNENQPMVEINTSNKNGRTLLLIKDSYAHCMVPMLVNNYENILILDLRGAKGGIISNFIPMFEELGYSIDDIVVLYNAENFTEDKNLAWLAR